MLWVKALATIALLAGGRWTEAQEVRIPAYPGNRTRPSVLRIIPSDSVLVRLRKPESSKPAPDRLGESTITRIQPVRLTPRVDLGDALRRMRLHSMAALIRKARLQRFLMQEAGGPVTLFAPTDEAFSMSSPPSDPDRLRDFVLQHAVGSRVTAPQLRNDATAPSLRSGHRPLRFNVYEDGQMLTVSGSQFLDGATDVGSVRVQPIDRVLYPISDEDLVNEVRLTFPRMHRFLLNSSLTSQLTSGTFTLFAPTDAAFEALASEVRQKLFHNATLMRKVLLNHVVPGTHYSAVLAHGYYLRSLGGEPVHFTNRRGLILANGIPVVRSDISVSNGVIHAVNRLLLPPELHIRRRPATMAPPPSTDGTRTPVPPSRHDAYAPVPTYVEPAPSVPRSLTKTMSTPLQFPDGRTETFSTASSLFRRSLLMTTLRNNMTGHSFTILMPTDGAFDVLEPGTLDRMRRDTRLLRRMLLAQMIEGKLDLSPGPDRPVRSLGGTVVIASLDGGKSLMAGGARVLSVRRASNGLVLVTDRVSFPPPPKTVVEALAPLVALRRVVEGQADIRKALEGSAYTVFAPTDAALASLTSQQQQDPKFLSELFWSHVVPGVYYRSRLSPGLRLTTVRGTTISIRRTPDGGVLANDVPLTGEEILAGNGVVHKLDSVLFVPGGGPPSTGTSTPEDGLAEIARRFNATLFLDWMKKAQMRDILRTRGSRGCTLFLPTDSALRSMSATLRSSTLGDDRRLRKFVLYHVSPDPLRWESVADNALLPTLLPGKRIRCNVYATDGKPGVLSVSGCRVSAMRPLGDNVTVAVIEGTMSPPAGNTVLTASKTPFLSNFSKILRVAEAEQLIADGGPYTLFAPDACVFAKVDPAQYRQIIANKKLAREFVRRYLVRGCYYSSGFYDGQILVTEAGTELVVRVTPDCVLVSGTRILYGDMSSSDGVLHVVDGSLPSPTD